MVLAWRIYYDDGSTFDSSQGSPCDAPAWGVIGVVQRDVDDPRIVRDLREVDYYSHDGVMWIGHDWMGVLDRLVHRMPMQGFLVGRWVQPRVYREVVDKILNDPEMRGPFTAEELAGG